MRKTEEKTFIFTEKDFIRILLILGILFFCIICIIGVTIFGKIFEKQIDYFFVEKIILENGNKVITEHNYRNEKWKEHIYSKDNVKIKEIIFDNDFVEEKIYFDKNEKPRYSVKFSDNAFSIVKEIFFFDNENPRIVLDYSWYYIATRKPILDKEVTYYKSGNPKTIVEFKVNNKQIKWKYTRCFNKEREEVKCKLNIHGCTNKSKACVNKKELEKVRNEANNKISEESPQ